MSAEPALAPRTRVRLRATALPMELETDTGRTAHVTEGRTYDHIVALDRPARYATAGWVVAHRTGPSGGDRRRRD